jgi:hypothetical protein
MAVPPSPQPGQEPPTTAENAVRLLIPLGTAVIVVILVALGIEGDVRSRFIRNEPSHVFTAFGLVLLGLAIPVLVKAGRGKKDNRWPPIIGGVLVLLGALWAIFSGAQSVGEREQPDVSVAASSVAGDPSMIDVVVSASGTSLRTDDTMLLRVVAIRPEAASLRWQVCEDGDQEAIPEELRKKVDESVTEPARLLSWSQSGPTATGTSSAEAAFEVARSEFRFVCVYVALSSRGSSDARAVASMVDLRNAAKAKTERATPK